MRFPFWDEWKLTAEIHLEKKCLRPHAVKNNAQINDVTLSPLELH